MTMPTSRRTGTTTGNHGGAPGYNRAAPRFRQTTKRAIEHIANEDLRQRVNEISDAKAKREVWLQANEAFNYPCRTEKP
jgi:hypothetical protein